MQNHKYMYNMLVRPNLGKYRVTAVKKSDVKRFYNLLADDRALKVVTIDNVHNVLLQTFAMAVDDSIIRINPTDNVLKERKRSRNFKQVKRKALTKGDLLLVVAFGDYFVCSCLAKKNMKNV